MPDKKILMLVEDNPGDVFLLKKALTKANVSASVVVAEDGAEAMKLMEAYNETKDYPYLILLDINLPKLSGLEVLRNLKSDKSFKHVPVVMFTSSDRPLDIEAAYDAHVNAYMVKPQSLPDLITSMKAFSAFWLENVKPPPIVK